MDKTNQVVDKWKPSGDDILGIFIGMIYISAVYAFIGVTFIGTAVTTFIVMVLVLIVVVVGYYVDTKRSMPTSIVFSGIFVQAIAIIALIALTINSRITLAAFSASLAIQLTGMVIKLLQRGKI